MSVDEIKMMYELCDIYTEDFEQGSDIFDQLKDEKIQNITIKSAKKAKRPIDKDNGFFPYTQDLL